MAPLQVLDENAVSLLISMDMEADCQLPVMKLKPVSNVKGLKQSKPPGEIESQLYEMKSDLRHVEKQQAVMKTQQANLHDKCECSQRRSALLMTVDVSLQHDVDELKSVSGAGLQVQTPLRPRVDAGCGPSPPVPGVHARAVHPSTSMTSSGMCRTQLTG